MTAADINRALNYQFTHYEYRLNNCFLFSLDWESDFLCQSKAGYWVEVEVKISRGDYFRDFGKANKHKLFRSLFEKKTHVVQNLGGGRGDRIGETVKVTLNSDYNGEDRWGRTNWRREVRDGKVGYWVNDYGNVWLTKDWPIEMRAPATHIAIYDLAKTLCPHQFYFAVPKNLVKLEEVPDYAGLIYIDGTNCRVVRKAPYLHKRSMDISRQLLKQYYHLFKYKTGGDYDRYIACLQTNHPLI